MPSSRAQVKMAHAVLSGKASSSGMSKSFAQEVVAKMHEKSMKSLPEHGKSPHPPHSRYPRHPRRGFVHFLLLMVLALVACGAMKMLHGQSPEATILDYDASGNILYYGRARSPGFLTTFSVAACVPTIPHCAAMTNIVDSGSTATVTATSHGLRVGQQITVAGASAGGLNTSYIIQTVPTTSTFTITTSDVADATYTTGVTITTRAARTVDPVWQIQKFVYDSSVLGAENLNEGAFATHADWDVAGGFVDSGGNGAYTHTDVETLTETNFTTHANWNVTGDFNDGGGNAAWTHATGAGTLTQPSGSFAVAASGDTSYDFTYTIGTPSGDGACNITTAFATTNTALTMTAGAHTTTFTTKASPGDFVISCTSTSGAFTIDNVALAKTTQSGTLTQTAANQATTADALTHYRFTYTVSGYTTDPACSITTAFAYATTSLTMTNGVQTTDFISAAAPGSFVISCTSTAGDVTFDDVSLTPLTTGGSVAGVLNSLVNQNWANRATSVVYY